MDTKDSVNTAREVFQETTRYGIESAVTSPFTEGGTISGLVIDSEADAGKDSGLFIILVHLWPRN